MTARDRLAIAFYGLLFVAFYLIVNAAMRGLVGHQMGEIIL